MVRITVSYIQGIARRHGATFSTDGNVRQSTSIGHGLYLDAPDGKVWRESGCHVSCAIHGHDYHGALTGEDLRKALADVQKIIDLGTEDCTDEDCDVCGIDD